MQESDCKIGPTRYGVMLYDPSDLCAGYGFHKYGEYSEAEVEIFRQYCGDARLALDIGANIGAHSIAMAQIFKEVIACEISTGLARILAANLSLNQIDNVQILAADARQIATVLPYDVPVDLIKVDVDGPEVTVLKALQPWIGAWEPTLYIENDRPQWSEERIDYIYSIGYVPFWHPAKLYSEANYKGVPLDACDGPNISMMMLCVPKDRPYPPMAQALPGSTSSIMEWVSDKKMIFRVPLV